MNNFKYNLFFLLLIMSPWVFGHTVSKENQNYPYLTSSIDFIVESLNSPCDPPELVEIEGELEVCEEGEQIYSVIELPGVSYTWTFTGVATITGNGSASITLEDLQQGGILAVTPSSECGDGNTISVLVEMLPKPELSVGVDEIELCEGETLSLHVSGGQAMWVKPNGDTLYSTDPVIPNISLDDAGVYTAVLSDKNGCSVKEEVEVFVLNSPEFTVLVDKLNICEGEEVEFSLSGDADATYIITPDIGLTGAGSVTLQPTETTEYHILADNGDCQREEQIEITVNEVFEPSFTLQTEYCEGETFEALPPSSLEGYPGTWTPGIIQEGVDTYVFSMDNSTCAIGFVLELTFNSNPTPVIDGPSTYCEGGSVSLTTTESYAGYQWSTGSSSATISGVTEHFSPITVTVTDVNGCEGVSEPFELTETNIILTNTLIQLCEGDSALVHGVYESLAGVYEETYLSVNQCDSISKVSILIVPNPVLVIDGVGEYCEGDDVTISLSGATSYEWTLPNGMLHTGSVLQMDGITLEMNGAYTVSMETASCQGDSTFVIGVTPLPTIGIIENTPVCEGETIYLEATGGDTYEWEDPQGFTYQSNILTVSDAALTDAGDYIVTVTENGCSKDLTVRVDVIPLPVISFSIENPENCNEPGVVTLTFDHLADSSYTLVYDGGILEVDVVNGEAIVEVSAGTYNNIRVYDGTCVSSQGVSFVVINPDAPIAPIINVTPPTCDEVSGAFITNYDDNLDYLFSPAGPVVNNGIIEGLSVGVYSVSASEAGCTSLAINLIVEDKLDAPEEPAFEYEYSCDEPGVITITNYNSNYSYDFSEPGLSLSIDYSIVGAEAGVEYELTVGNGICGTTVEFVLPEAIGTPEVSVNSEDGLVEICEGESVTLVGEGAEYYTWSHTNEGGEIMTFSPSETTTFVVYGEDAYGCVGEDSITITVHSLINVIYDDVYSVCYGEDVKLQVMTEEAATATWYFNDEEIGTGGSVEVSNVTQNNSGVYEVAVTSSNGCTTWVEITVNGESCEINIPEAFSPNGDGENDYFVIGGLEAYPNSEIWIYNRWGTKVFHNEDYLNEWDGRSQSQLNVRGDELPEGTYYYVLKLGGVENQLNVGEVHKGFVYLTR